MIRPLILVTVSYLALGCAPRLSGTHFDRWAKEDLARNAAEAPAAAPSPTPVTPVTPAAPATPAPPPAPAASPGYPDEASSGTTSPESPPEGRVVSPPEDDEVLY